MTEDIPPMKPNYEFSPGNLAELIPDLQREMPDVWSGVRDRFDYGKRYVVVSVKDPMIYVVDSDLFERMEDRKKFSDHLKRFDPTRDIGSDEYIFVKSIGLNLLRRVAS